VTAASDISVDGYVGKAFQRTAPTDMSDCSTRRYGMRTGDVGVNSDFRSWENQTNPPVGPGTTTNRAGLKRCGSLISTARSS
jgi:hypothetical protein